MKKSFQITLFVILNLVLITSCKTEEKHPNLFTLEGEIKDLKSNLLFRHPDKEYTRDTPYDTIKVVNGKIKFSDTISKLSLISASPSLMGLGKSLFKIPKGGDGYFPVKSSSLIFYAMPGGHVTVAGEATDFMNAYPSGNSYNNNLAAINKIAFPSVNKMGNIAVQNTYETDSLKIKENNQKSEKISETNTNALITHIKNNPKSLGAVWYLKNMLIRKQIHPIKAGELFNTISKELSEHEDYKNIATRLEAIKATEIGAPVPSIKTTSTLDGNEFDINALRGKYVLIDFWGIWCGPCVKEMPTVKAFQEKHEDKLIVLGINVGDTKENIKKFINENGYTWQHLVNDDKNISDNFMNRFNVSGFPTKFIIDPRGNIVKKYIGGSDDAFIFLEALFDQ
ncbi:TlpA disulfide reductase family protein [uncultured Algibacter sp.]|uniref:TlpA family protein disulfide reductase n=1 Tax=uncultured Algibacter sp. TaxID=298659 RepID=UPI003216E365